MVPEAAVPCPMPQCIGVFVQVVEDVASAMESGGSERSEFDKQLVDIIRFMDGKDANQLRDEFHRLVRPRTQPSSGAQSICLLAGSAFAWGHVEGPEGSGSLGAEDGSVVAWGLQDADDSGELDKDEVR